MYDRNKEMSDKLFKFIVKNIPYESENAVLNRIKLNNKLELFIVL